MTGRPILAAVLTALPVFVLLRYFYRKDVHPEPRALLVKTFLLGIVLIAPLYPVAYLLALLAPTASAPWVAAAYEAFVLAAIPEELLKFVVLRAYAARRPAFDEPMDGIVYGATAALGFAAFENALYVWEGGWITALVRAFTSVPMHAACGAILGYFVARSVFEGGGRRALWTGFAWAVLAHGIYDFGLMAPVAVWIRQAEKGVPVSTGAIWLMLLTVAALGISVVWTVRTVRRLRRGQLAIDS